MANFWENDPILDGPAPPDAVGARGGTVRGKPNSSDGQFWLNDPVLEDAAPPQALSVAPNLTGMPLVGPLAGAMGYDGRVTAEALPSGPGTQERYDAALERYRQLTAADMPVEDFRRTALGEGRMPEPNPFAAAPLLGPLTTAALALNKGRGALSPYDATQLSQHGALFGATDEMSAGMDALGAGVSQMFGGKGPAMGDVWNARLELEQARRDLGREQQGLVGTLAEAAAGIASGGAAAKGASVLGGGTHAPRMWAPIKATAGATASGAAYGFGSSDGDLGERGQGAAVGAGTAALLSAGAPVLFRGGQRFMRGLDQRTATRQAVRSAPSAATIKARAKGSYKASEATGAIVDQNALNILQFDIRALLRNEGVMRQTGHKVLGGYPKVRTAIRIMDDYTSKPMTMKEAQRLLKAFRKVANSTDPDESRLGVAMIDEFDRFFDGLPPQAFSQGNGLEAIKHWTSAKNEYARFARARTIESAMYAAKLYPSGFAAGLRNEFKKILTQAKKRRGFSADELKAIERFAEGGRVEDFLQFMTSGGSLSAAFAGHTVGGPAGAAAMAGAKIAGGALARRQLNRNAQRTADQVRAQVALPGGIPKVPLTPRDPLIEAVARRLAVRSGNPLLEKPREALPSLLRPPAPLWTGGR